MNTSDVRLIERWLPIAELGVESVRENGAAIKATPNRLHVWWARRPLVASRAAILASLLPADADRKRFMHILGIHGDPIETRRRINDAKRTGEDLGLDPYGYKRAFQYTPSDEELRWSADLQASGVSKPLVVDPTAGGGAIPFEAMRLGVRVVANDLNPVAALLLKLTVQAPREYGKAVLNEYRRLAKVFVERATPRFAGVFPEEPGSTQILGYLWARTICCPYCDGLVPLSPNWRLAPDGRGVKLLPDVSGGRNTPGRVCRFEIVPSAKKQSPGTVTGGDATCPYPDCGRVIDGDEVKRQAQARGMGDQLFAIVFKRRVEKKTKTGKVRTTWERGYRAPAERDQNLPDIERRLAEKLQDWEANDIIPSEIIPDGLKTSEPLRYGMTSWRDLFNVRQLYGHCTAVEIYQELLAVERGAGKLKPETMAAFGYLSLVLDKMLNYNARLCRWHTARELMVGVFDRHDFAFYFSYAEMAPLITGLGYDWAMKQTEKCVQELIQLSGTSHAQSSMSLTSEDASHLSHVTDESVDAVVIDPPYGANVMYAELSDFFYVWLKRTAGLVFPELFRMKLTDKENEAVANPARYHGQRGATELASDDYRRKMAAIFAECRRVLKPNGIMTLMFTHKETGAWDALTQGLIKAGFVITASWPINTESESSLHIRDKAAANSTIFLVCRPRDRKDETVSYWDGLEAEVRKAVRERIGEFQEAGMQGVDLYLASFGPALKVFSSRWPVQRMTPRPPDVSSNGKRKKRCGGEDAQLLAIDPYAVTPEDALDVARAEVKRWRFEQLSKRAAREGLDAATSWFVLAWDAFGAAVFPYDEALRLARVCGVDLDGEIVGRYAGKKGKDLTIWDSSLRANNAALGSSDGSRSMLDALHHAAHLARTRTLDAARALLEEHDLLHREAFMAAFDAVRQVLPMSRQGIELPATAAGAGEDFRALEELRKLLYANELELPQQLAALRTPRFEKSVAVAACPSASL